MLDRTGTDFFFQSLDPGSQLEEDQQCQILLLCQSPQIPVRLFLSPASLPPSVATASAPSRLQAASQAIIMAQLSLAQGPAAGGLAPALHFSQADSSQLKLQLEYI